MFGTGRKYGDIRVIELTEVDCKYNFVVCCYYKLLLDYVFEQY